MNPEQLHVQRETDEDILHYVRGMQSTAPIRVESVHSYLTRHRRRRVDLATVRDRLGYLTGKGYLSVSNEFCPGENYVDFYEITADGRDVLDGAKPWS